MKIPREIRAGDSITWEDIPTKDNLGNPIDSSWTLKYEFRGAQTLTLTATTNGTGWSTALSAANSATLSEGVYYWIARATKALESVTLGAGQVKILPNLTTTTAGYDGRSQSKKDLDAVQGAMRAMIAGGAVAEYTINGRSLRKLPLPDLIQLEGILKARCVREEKADRIANGLGNPSNIFVRFSK